MEKGKDLQEGVRPETSRALSPFDEAERWFEDAFRRPLSLFGPSWLPKLRFSEMDVVTPSVDIFEDANNVVVKAEIPGIKKEDIDLRLTDDVITISGEKKKEDKVEKKNYCRLERSYGSFTRSFRLPKEVQADKANAKFENGILEISIPKTEQAKNKEKKINIS